MKLLILVFAIVAIAAAVPTTHFLYGTSGQEVVYKYHADVRTGVAETSYGSQFIFRADLHMTLDTNGNGSYAFFKNPSVFVYNGELLLRGYHIHNVPDFEYVPIIKESESILKPFYITYDHSGLVHEIFTQPEDQEWSVNLKKGVASFVQLDFEEIHKHSIKTPYAFVNTECTTFGNVNVTYDVQPHDEYYIVQKTLDDSEFRDMTYEVYSNIELEASHKHFERHNYTYPETTYHVLNKKDGHVVQKIEGFSIQLFAPFGHNNEIYYVSTNQSITYVGTNKPDHPLDISSCVDYHLLTYSHVHRNVENHFPDPSVVHRHIEMDVVAPKVQAMFYEAFEYLQENPITKTETDTKHGLTINRIVYALKTFTVDNYEQLWTYCTKTVTPKDLAIVELFYKVLPTVGTKSSAIFVKNLIKKHKVKDFISTSMLYSLGLNIRVPSVELLKELEDLCNMEDVVKPEVAHAAILTYGSLVYRTFKHHTESPVLEKYIKLYYNKLREAKTYEEQLIWLHGLKNIQVGSVYQLLRPIVHGEQVLNLPYNRHLQLHTIYSLQKILSFDHNLLFEIVWPVFVDPSLNIELRVAALKVIISTNNLSHYGKVFWIMQNEQNAHLYSYYYTYIHGLADSSILPGTHYYLYAKLMTKYYKHVSPAVGTKSFYYDYVDHDSGFGGAVSGNMVADEKYNKLNQIYIRFSPYIMDSQINLYSMFVKFEGVENPLAALLPKLFSFKPDLFKTSPMKTHEKVPVHVEITLMANGKVVYSKFFNEETFQNFYTHTYLSLLSTVKNQFTSVLNTVETEVYMPTIIGIPAKFHAHIPIVTQFKYDVTVPAKDAYDPTFKVISQIRYWIHGTYGVTVYNPFAATSHGVRRVNAIDINIPFYYNVGFNFAQDTLKLTFEKSLNEAYNTLGFKTHVKTQVFVHAETDVDYLKSTCASCHHYVTPTLGKKYSNKNFLIYESHGKNTGLHQYLALYDVEASPKTQIHKSLSHFLVSDELKNIGTMPVFKFLVSYYTFFLLNFLPPQHASYGVVGYQNHCKVHPVEKTELVFRFDHEHVEYQKWTVPSVKINMRVSAVFKGPQDLVLNNWDANIAMYHQEGVYFKDVNVQLTRHTPGEKNLNVCFDWDRSLSKESVTGKFHYYAGYSYEHKCVKDDFGLSVHWVGTESDNQRNYTHDPIYSYKDCVAHYFNVESDVVSFDCAVEHTSIRKYVYNIDYHNVPTYYNEIFNSVWQWVHVVFPSYYDYTPHHHVSSNSIVVDVEYPVFYDHPIVNFAVTFPEESFVFEHVPYYDWLWVLQPTNAYFTRYFQFMKSLGHVQTCGIYPTEKLATTQKKISHVAHTPAYNEWSLYAADGPVNHTWAVYVQKVKDEHVALKVVLNEHVVIVQPSQVVEHHKPTVGSQFSFIMDDKMMHYMQTHYDVDDFYSFKVFQVNNSVLFTVPHVSLYVVYDGYHVAVQTVKQENTEYYGLCYV